MNVDSTGLFIGLIFGSIGFGYFIYGKRQKRKPVLYTGVALMVYPYFITGTLAMVLTGLVLMALPRILPDFD